MSLAHLCREASINDVSIIASERRLFAPRAEGDDEVIPLT